MKKRIPKYGLLGLPMIIKCIKDRKEKKRLCKTEAEVERLRSMIERAMGSCSWKEYDAQYPERLAPAPEEPVNPICSNTTHKFSHCDCTEPAPDKNTELNTDKDTEQPVSNSEWRELGEDEVIQEGDEIQWPYKDWQTAKSSIGYKVGYWDGLVKARTRRPLPKQKWIPNPNYATATHEVDLKLPKQEEMPLETFQYHLMLCEDAGENDDLLQCLRYLRDEIQKLKNK
jgi:hypothetical protein